MRDFRDKLSYGNVMATIAVFLAVTGVGYAAATLPKDSVGAKQLKDDAVKSPNVKQNALTGSDIDEATLDTGDVQSASIPNVGAGLVPYAAISGITTSPSVLPDGVESLTPNVPLVAGNLAVSFDQPPSGSGDVVGVALENDGSVLLSCEVEGASTERTCTTDDTANVPAASPLSLRVINGTSATNNFRVGFSLTSGD